MSLYSFLVGAPFAGYFVGVAGFFEVSEIPFLVLAAFVSVAAFTLVQISLRYKKLKSIISLYEKGDLLLFKKKVLQYPFSEAIITVFV